MKLTNYNSTQNPIRPMLRSLLQKAVRRGYPELSQKVAFLLARYGDSDWLRIRTGVIAFEECWPSAGLLIGRSPAVVTLRAIASSIKNKDAAGLGSMAQAAANGDTKALEMAHDPIAVKIIAAALSRPDDFFKWVTAECQSQEQSLIIQAARIFFSGATFAWDKAFMAAAAYLSIKEKVPNVSTTEQTDLAPFPYWIALDKHTPQGKIALKRVAMELSIASDQLQWASFYFESAKSQAMVQSPWWDCERRWRFATLRFDLEHTKEIWQGAAPHVQAAVNSQALALSKVVEEESDSTL